MKKYWLVIILSMMAVAMGMIKLSYREAEYPLRQLLPYSGDGFTVDKYLEPLTLLVKIKEIDKKIVAEEIGKWMEANGVNPETHRIVISEK